MARLLIFFSLGLFAAVLQGSVLKLMAPALVVPNLVLSLVVYLSFYSPTVSGALISFLLGTQLDLFCSRELLGPYAAALVVVFGCVASFSQRLFLESSLTVFVVTLVATVFTHIIVVIVTSQFISVASVVDMMFRYSIVEGFLTALFTPLVFKLLKLISKRVNLGMLDEYRGLSSGVR